MRLASILTTPIHLEPGIASLKQLRIGHFCWEINLKSKETRSSILRAKMATNALRSSSESQQKNSLLPSLIQSMLKFCLKETEGDQIWRRYGCAEPERCVKPGFAGNTLHKLPCQRDAVSMNHDQAIRAFISSMPTVMQTLRSTSSRRLGAKIDT